MHIRYEGRHEPKREEFIDYTPWVYTDELCYITAVRISLLRSFASNVTLHTIAVIASAVLSTYMCYKLSLNTDMPINFIAAALIFPISFGYGFFFSTACYSHSPSVLFFLSSLSPSPSRFPLFLCTYN